LHYAEPELFSGYDPKRKGFTQEVELQHDLQPIEASAADAERFKLEHGSKVRPAVVAHRSVVSLAA
jgi:fatty acid synthase subunit alpha